MRTIRKRILITIVALLAVVLLAFTLWQSSQGDGGVPPQPQAARPAAGTLPQAGELLELESGPVESGAVVPSPRPMGDTRASELRQLLLAQEPIPHDVALAEYKSKLWSEIQANPPNPEAPGDPALDADMAYRLYMYFGNCSMSPRTPRHVDQRLEKIAQHVEKVDSKHLEGLENRADQIIDFYELCLPIPPDVDPRVEAVSWMAEAARLGHEIAQIQFYEKAMGFLLRRDRNSNSPPIAMQHPDMIHEFKATARFALARALEKGHPEAYVAMSQALFDGVIYPKDPVKAMAYARVAEMTAARSRIISDLIGRQKQTVAAFLDQEQMREAEELAQRIRLGEDA